VCTIRADGEMSLPVSRKKSELPHAGRRAGRACPTGGRGPVESPLEAPRRRVLSDLPGRRLRQQARLERLGIGVRQQKLGRAEAELAGTLRDAGALRRWF